MTLMISREQYKNEAPIVTRASEGTYLDSDGLLKVAGINEPRVDYTTGVGILLEEELATNIIEYSEDISLSYWSKARSSVSPTLYESPTGLFSARKLVVSTDLNSHPLYKTSIPVVSGEDYTISVFVKTDDVDYFVLTANSGGGNVGSYELNTNSVHNGNTRANIVDFGNGWHRCSLSFIANDSIVTLYIEPSTNGTNGYFQGNGTDSILLWGIQLEKSNSLTSYIPTNGSIQTRAEETIIKS